MYPPYHNEWISRPEISPFWWTLRCRHVLTVYRDGRRWSFTHRASADVWPYFRPLQRLRGTGGRGGQPEGFVVATRVSARFHITTGERHCAEHTHTWTRLACGTHTNYLCKLMYVYVLFVYRVCVNIPRSCVCALSWPSRYSRLYPSHNWVRP